jgi:hypothetical protein
MVESCTVRYLVYMKSLIELSVVLKFAYIDEYPRIRYATLDPCPTKRSVLPEVCNQLTPP